LISHFTSHFLLYIVTKQTCWINLIITVESPLSVATYSRPPGASNSHKKRKKKTLACLACLCFLLGTQAFVRITQEWALTLSVVIFTYSMWQLWAWNQSKNPSPSCQPQYNHFFFFRMKCCHTYKIRRNSWSLEQAQFSYNTEQTAF